MMRDIDGLLGQGIGHEAEKVSKTSIKFIVVLLFLPSNS